MRGTRNTIVLATVAALIVPIGAVSAGIFDRGVPEHLGAGRAGIQQAGDITHVKNIGGWSGSDIEFSSQEVVKLSDGATGDPVCQTDASGACLVDEAGNIVYQTEVRDFAIAGALSQNARIIDITDPANAQVVAQVPCAINQNDIQVQGDLLLVAADGSGICRRPDGTSAGFAGTAVLDFSDPRNPKYLSRLQYGRGSHNHTFVPGKPFVYLSDSDLASTGLGNIPIWDLTDPAAPALVREFKHLAHSPHDITFNNAGTRAYAAAVSATYILNTEDPRNPSVIATIPNEGISISHQSDPTPDGNYLLIADEMGGGAAGVSPGGPVHVYDIRDEAHPVKIGLIWDDCVGLSNTCQDAGTLPEVGVPISTAHVFRINPDGYTMAIAWYKDGVHVIDYTDIRGANAAGVGAAVNIVPRTIGRMRMPNANTWAAKMWQEKHPGYVFANDINRGLDIFYVSALGGDFHALGTVHAAHILNYEVGVGVTRTDFETNCEYSPRTNGVDGWVTALSPDLAGKSLTVEALTSAVGNWDIDLYYYNQSCTLVAADEDPGTIESGEIPEGARYVMAAVWTAMDAGEVDAQLKLKFSVS